MCSCGTALYLQCFLNKMDLNFGILVKSVVGLLGKSVMSRKSWCVIFNIFVRISRIAGWYSVNLTHCGVNLSASEPFIFGFNMYSRLVCFIFHNLSRMCLLYPLLAKCFTNFLLYFGHMLGDVVLQIILVVSPLAMPLKYVLGCS